MDCKHCGYTNNLKSRFCNNCSSPLATNNYDLYEPKQESGNIYHDIKLLNRKPLVKRQNNLMLGFLLIMIVILLFSGYLFYTSKFTPKGIVEGYLSDFKAGNFYELSKYISKHPKTESILLSDSKNLSSDTDEEYAYQLLAALSTRYAFKDIKELSSSTSDYTRVQVTVTTVDIKSILTTYLKEVISTSFTSALIGDNLTDTDFKTMLLSSAQSSSSHMTTQTIVLNLKKDDKGSYKIVGDDNALRVLIGNYVDVSN